MVEKTEVPSQSGAEVMPLSVLILTLNEADNIGKCIGALEWSDDIVLVDSFSTDSTVDDARALGARVYQRKFDNFANQRNFALEEISFKHEWVLHLDADELVTPALRDELRATIANPDFDAYRVPSMMMFLGKWLRYAGMYPSYQVRLGHLNALRFKQVGHGQRENLSSDQIGTLNNPYIHDCFSKGITEWIEKHNRYSSDEARHGIEQLRHGGIDWRGVFNHVDKTRRRRAIKGLVNRLPFRPSIRFVYMYVLRRGFLDGRAGFVYCRLLASYEYWIVLKMKELTRGS